MVRADFHAFFKATAVLAGVVLLTIFFLPLALSAACDSESDKEGVGRTPMLMTPLPTSKEVTTINSGGSVEFETREARPGQTIRVTGTDWNGIGPVKIYLLTEEQYGAPGFRFEDEPVSLGEQTTADGTVSLEFRLAASYETPDGSALVIRPGQELYVMAKQETERGAHRSGSGPLIVSADERE